MSDKEFLQILRDIGYTPQHTEGYSGHELKYPEDTQEELSRLYENVRKYPYGDPKRDVEHEIYRWAKKAADDIIFAEVGEGHQVEQVGGEGEGDHYHIVEYFPKVDKYVYASATYISHNGVDYWDDEWTIVRPVEKTITVYE